MVHIKQYGGTGCNSQKEMKAGTAGTPKKSFI
jgi:hypothetical protein